MNILNSSQKTVEKIRGEISDSKLILFIPGNFNICHPGHIRLIKFAREFNAVLIVGVFPDSSSGIHLPQTLRAEALSFINLIDYVITLDNQYKEFLQILKPDIILKGKEHEYLSNEETEIANEYGGKLIFSSGDSLFSSSDLIGQELSSRQFDFITPNSYIKRHNINKNRIREIISKFTSKNVIVLGDLIVDEYLNCHAVGMSQEEPVVVAVPLNNTKFVGGAGIVAIHVASAGSKSHYFGAVGSDELHEFSRDLFERHGVDNHLFVDSSRPTTLKQRFRIDGRTHFRLSHYRQHEIDQIILNKVLERCIDELKRADLIIFSDFGYGFLSDQLIDTLIKCANEYGVLYVADSQSSSQVGNISRFKGALLITPTEYEARLVLSDKNSGLSVLSELLADRSVAQNIMLTLGNDGVFVQTSKKESYREDQLPALNCNPIDISGAGDCL